MFLNKFGVHASQLKAVFEKEISLSSYFPDGTQFYYGYPAGEDSGFLNKVTPSVEELVAARANSCAGKNVSVVNFSATTAASVPQDILNDFCLPQLSPGQTIILPEAIDLSVEGLRRNDAVKKALKELITPGQLVMAQPYTDPDLTDLYQIPAKTTAWLNDKSNMEEYIGADMLPKRYGVFTNGAEFLGAFSTVPAPAVVKASLSSSGDGVCLCETAAEIEEAANKFAHLEGTILVEQYIKTVTNYGVHFGIPQNKKRPIDIIGVNEQLTTEKGEFIGGLIHPGDVPKELTNAIKHLKNDILPKVRSMGWYGIGGFDVLVDTENNAYFIDCNFRMTGMSAYHFLIANNVLKKPIAAFSGDFHGTAQEFKDKLYLFAQKHSNNKFLQLITISKHEDTWRFNGVISFETQQQLKDRAGLILTAGVDSLALKFLAS
jgi:hypothetical protein